MVGFKVILVIRDGWGYTEETKGNAIYLSNTPNNDKYMDIFPWTLLKCTGNAVGLPDGTQGGSEPGHITIGAGRVVWQPLEIINRAIGDGSFYRNKALLIAIRKNRKNRNKLHLMGLLSDQGIHGTIHHLYALLELARREKMNAVYIHCFLDGRDVPEKSAKRFLRETLKTTNEKGIGYIASIIGRYYSMDRDNNWDRTQKAYDLLILGEGHKERDVFEAVDNAYDRGDESDYYIKPIVMVNEFLKPIATIDNSDSVICWNFRSDRARQITYALTKDSFEAFLREKYPKASKKFDIEVIATDQKKDISKLNAVDIKWTKRKPSPDAKNLDGCYVLRSDRVDLKDEEIWHIYAMLTKIEKAFKIKCFIDL